MNVMSASSRWCERVSVTPGFRWHVAANKKRRGMRARAKRSVAGKHKARAT